MTHPEPLDYEYGSQQHQARKYLATLTALAALASVYNAAALDDGAASHISIFHRNDKTPPPPTDEMAKRIEETEQLSDMVNLRDMYPKQPETTYDGAVAKQDSVFAGPALLKAATATRDSSVIEQANETFNADDSHDGDLLKQDLGKIGDPALEARAVHAVQAGSVDDMLDRVGTNDAEPSDVRAYTQKLGWKLKDVKEAVKAAEALDAADISDSIQSFSDDTALNAARKDIADIKSQDVRKLATRSIESKVVFNDFERIGYHGMTVKVMQNRLHNLKDPVVRTMATTALRTYSPADYNWPYSDKAYAVLELSQATSDTIDDRKYAATVYSDELDEKASDLVEGLKPDLLKLNKTIAREIRESITTYNKIPPADEKVIRVISPADPGQVVDLSGVRGTRVVEDPGSPNLDGRQFAELYSNDGRLMFTVTPHSGLKPEAAEQIQTAIHNVTPFIEAAMRSGDLLTVRFVVSPDFNPYSYGRSREIVMALPANKTISKDLLQSVMLHESVHALVNSVVGPEHIVDAGNVTKIKNACWALSKASYDSFADRLALMPDKLDTLASGLPVEDGKIVAAIKKAALDGTIASLMKNHDARESYNAKDLYATDCETLSFKDLVKKVAVANHMKKPDEIADRFIDTLSATDKFDEVFLLWDETMTDYSLYSQFKESAFVTTDYEGKDSMGHPRDNANEMIATFADVSLSYPDALADKLNRLDTDEQKPVLQTIRAVYDLLSARHPELKPYFTSNYKHISRAVTP